ncbi:MAG: magnesium transporter CorA family protein [Thermaerobacter sp.]|nr:magnesium transporter CorA family protein [Thermaerobacter sp.]
MAAARFLYSRDEQTAEAETFPEQADYVWADLRPAEHTELAAVVNRLYPAHPAAISRVLRADEVKRPSLLVEDDALVFVVALHATLGAPQHVADLGVFLGRAFLVTVHLSAHDQTVRDAWEFIKRNELLDQGTDFALYQLLSRHLEDFRTLLRQVDGEFENVHRMMLQHPYRNLAPDILHLRKWTLRLQDVVQPEMEIFELLKSTGFLYVQKTNRPYFEDLAGQMRDLVGRVGSTREALSGTVEAYTSIQSNEINKVVKLLTFLSVLALPATTIASIYGMNFLIPELHWRYGYWYSLVLMGLVTTAILLYMRNRGWFRDKSGNSG